MKQLIILASVLVISRLIGLDPIWTPFFALAFLMPSITSNKYLGYLLPASIMFITDVYMSSMMFPMVYGCLLFNTFLATKLDKYVATFAGFFVWHILVNIGPGMYPPFSAPALLWDLQYLTGTLIYISIFDVAKQFTKLRLAAH
jgi:hypothetical protein